MKQSESHAYLIKQWWESDEIMWICTCTSDGDYVVEEYNPAEKKLWGDGIYTGMSLRRALGDAFEKETFGYRKCLETRVTLDGMVRHFYVCLTPVLRNPDDELPRIWGTAREITDIIEAREQMARINIMLETKVGERTATLEATNKELERLSYTDDLTGISNRRHFMALAEREISRARRYGKGLALLLLDLDRFKQVNDNHRHAAGDATLKSFTQVVRGALRASDLFARIGGDEFAILLPESGTDEVVYLVSRVNTLMATIDTSCYKGLPSLTASIGAATLEESDIGIDDMKKRADANLYAMKNGLNLNGNQSRSAN